MKLTNHIIKQANDKNIPLPVIHKIINEQVSLIKGDLDFGKRDRICTKCGTVKKQYTNLTPITVGGKDYTVKVVVCIKCDDAITCFPDERLKGYTPIHAYQWARGQRNYTAKCHDCGKKFVIDSQSMAECIRKTTHNCNGETRHIMEGN